MERQREAGERLRGLDHLIHEWPWRRLWLAKRASLSEIAGMTREEIFDANDWLDAEDEAAQSARRKAEEKANNKRR